MKEWLESGHNTLLFRKNVAGIKYVDHYALGTRRFSSYDNWEKAYDALYAEHTTAPVKREHSDGVYRNALEAVLANLQEADTSESALTAITAQIKLHPHVPASKVRRTEPGGDAADV
jgi:hypothetical protein